MSTDIARLFREAGCDGQLCVQPLDGGDEVALEADRPVVASSAAKVSIALEAETRFADGRLDPRERVVLRAGSRTLGPVGFSLYDDDVEVSLRDLVVAMLTISDNAATDALLDRIGVDAVNEASQRLGLLDTVFVSNYRSLIDSIGRDAGFEDWASLVAWSSQSPPPEELDRVNQQVRTASALTPSGSIRTTPRDMVQLLRLIWTDQAGPAAACQRVRLHMGRQLTRNRLAAAFPPPARVAAKSGSLLGVIRNEVGVIRLADGSSYLAAVFTQAHESGGTEPVINAAIAEAAAVAVNQLREGQPADAATA